MKPSKNLNVNFTKAGKMVRVESLIVKNGGRRLLLYLIYMLVRASFLILLSGNEIINFYRLSFLIFDFLYLFMFSNSQKKDTYGI